LSRLAELAALTLDTGKMEVLAEMNAFHIDLPNWRPSRWIPGKWKFWLK